MFRTLLQVQRSGDSGPPLGGYPINLRECRSPFKFGYSESLSPIKIGKLNFHRPIPRFLQMLLGAAELALKE